MFKGIRIKMTFSKNKFCLAVILTGLLFLIGCTNQSETTSSESRWFRCAQSDIRHLPDDIWQDTTYTFSNRNNTFPLLLAGGASIAMHNTDADENLDARDKRPQAFNSFSDEAFNIIGSPATHFVAAGLWYATSADANNDIGMQNSWTMIRALSLTGLVTVGLKAAVHNETPNGKSWAWPSGHTSSSFAAAATLDELYGPQVGIPAYGLAGLVGYRMMDTGDHWASDVLFGATLGWIVGHSVAGRQKDFELAGFKVLPYTAPTKNGSIVGINLIKRF